MKYLAMIVAASLLSSAAVADTFKFTLGTERALETEINSVYGSVNYGIASLGATLEDTATDSGSFNISKYELDFSQPIGPVTLYVLNDFDDDFKHSETVVGAKYSF
jgi:hypothetical protein